MQLIKKNHLFILLSFFTAIISHAQNKFDKDDYEIINLYFEKYEGSKDYKDKVIYSYPDSIFLKKESSISFNSDYFASLRAKEYIYEINNKKCEDGVKSVMDTIGNYKERNGKTWFCIMRDNNAPFVNLLNPDDRTYLIRQDKKIIKCVDENKIKNNKIIVIDSSFFSNKTKRKFPDKIIKSNKITMLEINGLNYNKNKNVAFLSLTENTIYNDTGDSISFQSFCIVFVKKEKKWEIIGNIDNAIYN